MAVTIDGEPVADPLEVAPRDPTFARGASGIAWLDSSTLAIDLEEESP